MDCTTRVSENVSAFLCTRLVPCHHVAALTTGPNVLGAVYFEAERAARVAANGVPQLSVEIGEQRTDYFAEVILSSCPVTYETVGRFQFGHDGENLFGCASLPEGDRGQGLDQLTRNAYLELFASLKHLGYPYLFRIWNYIPRINEMEDGLERYQAFCYGRNEAFEQTVKGFTGILPAATGIAKNTTGSVEIYLLAHKHSLGIHVENPRQTPAYRYSKKYGPKPPSFARATFIPRGRADELYVSGTASIIGSRSVHLDDPVKQCETALENIEILIGRDNLKTYGIDHNFSLRDMDSLKIYYRRACDFEVIRRLCERRFSAGVDRAYIHVNICRSDLLVEIEGSIQLGKRPEADRGHSAPKHVAGWMRQLGGNVPLVDLPTDRPRESNTVNHREAKSWHSSQEVEEAARELNVSVPTLVLAAFHALLFRYTHSEDLLVGVFLDGTGRIMPIATHCTGNLCFRELVSGLGISLDEAGQIGGLTPTELATVLNGEPQILFRLDDESGRGELTGCVELEPEIDFQVARGGDGLRGSVRYQATLFDPETIERLIGSWKTLLAELLAHLDEPIGTLNVLPPSELARRKRWNNTAATYPLKPLHELFEDQVEKTPDECAVSYLGNQTTYAALGDRASRLASALKRKGVGPGVPVGVYLDRSLDTLVAMLGIWKAGGAYVPLDLTYPATHLRFILEETRSPLLISSTEAAELGLDRCPADILRIDRLPESHYSGPGGHPDQLASIFYTSGSTGQPKGVAVSHHYHLRRLAWCWKDYPFQRGDVLAQRTTANFVVSMWEFLGGLLRGVPTVILPDEVSKDPQRLVSSLRDERVTCLLVVPSLLKMILDMGGDVAERLSQIRWWVTCGEPLPAALYRRFKEQLPNTQLVNQYGATEVFDVTHYDTRMEDVSLITNRRLRGVPIGRPISNTKIHILNEWMQPVPIGVPGELFIDTPGMAHRICQPGRGNRQEVHFEPHGRPVRRPSVSDGRPGTPFARRFD